MDLDLPCVTQTLKGGQVPTSPPPLASRDDESNASAYPTLPTPY